MLGPQVLPCRLMFTAMLGDQSLYCRINYGFFREIK